MCATIGAAAIRVNEIQGDVSETENLKVSFKV